MSDDPNETSIEAAPARKQPRPFSTFSSIAIAVVAVGLAIALLLPARRTAREAARRTQCLNQLKQIALAIQDYESATGALPPAYTVDAEGRRLHSWRTLILPYMEQTAFFKTIDLSKPWDDPANAAARKAAMDVYACPSTALEEGMTTYLGVVGPDCAFTGPDPRPLSDVTDDREETIAVVDVPTDQAVHWMSPHDVEGEALVELFPGAKTHHAGVIVGVFLGGHPRAILKGVDRNTLRAMLTVDGDESLDDDAE